jgi:hypothetical protein
VWALLLALDALPWPAGEDLLARLFALAAIAKPARLARAHRWGRAHAPAGAVRLALATCAFRGRWVARAALLGVREPSALRPFVRLRGEEHLAPRPRGTLLLGFHLGPPGADVALRLAGHRVAWLGGGRTSRAWRRPAWQELLDRREHLVPPDARRFWPGVLYRARQVLRDGGAVFITADAWSGRPLFRIPVPGGAITVRSGWLALQQHTGAAVVPVLSHLDGRTHVVTVHPPLPAPAPGAALPLEAWRAILTALAREQVARHPEQCPAVVFEPRLFARAAPAPRGPRRAPAAGDAR